MSGVSYFKCLLRAFSDFKGGALWSVSMPEGSRSGFRKFRKR